MTTAFHLSRTWLGLCALALAVSAVPALAVERASVSPTLKVHVITPPTWHILLEDRVSQNLVDQLREIFYRKDFAWPVEEVRYVENPAAVPHLLTLDVIEWRLNWIGNIDCTLRATLQTPRGERPLGVFSNTVPRWIGGFGRWGLSRAFEDAAEGALEDLCAEIARTELLPGLLDHAS